MLSIIKPHTILGQCTVAFAGLALIIAPFGCETLTLLQMFESDGGQFGWFVNQDKTSDTLLGARVASGASLFAYGSFDEDGNIAEITDVILRDAAGNESFISLDGRGWPIHIEIADGSYAHIDYEIQDETRVKGLLRLYQAGAAAEETVPFDVQLDEALEALAAELEPWTGQQLDVLPAPEETDGSKVARRDAAAVVYPLFLVPFVAMAYIVSYVALAISTFVVSVVAYAIRATLVAVLAPVYLLAEITNAALFLPISWVFLPGVFADLPGPPIWALI
jgi:hypothetical protein